MGFSKTEVNLRRLLATAPQQQNQAKLVHEKLLLQRSSKAITYNDLQFDDIGTSKSTNLVPLPSSLETQGRDRLVPLPSLQYVSTLREQLEQLVAETTPDGLPRVSKANVNDYSEKIEALAAKLAAQPSVLPEFSEASDGARLEEIPSLTEQEAHIPSPRLRRRLVSHTKVEDRSPEITKNDPSTPIKLDAEAHAHIEKHRKLQEDLTDELVGLAQKLKESSLMMSQSVQDTEKILDSTERAVEHSLASTGHANARAMEIYSESFKTTCFTWLLMFFMTCIFIMVVLLIRVT